MLLMVVPAVGAGLGAGAGLLFDELDEGGGVLAVEAELLEPLGVGVEAAAVRGVVAELLLREAPPQPAMTAITALNTPV